MECLFKKIDNKTTGQYEFEDFNYATLTFNILRDLWYNIENEGEIIEKSFKVLED